MKKLINYGKYMKTTNNLKSKFLALKKRYNQKNIAKRIGITQTYLSQVINGRKPSDEVMQKLLKILDEQ